MVDDVVVDTNVIIDAVAPDDESNEMTCRYILYSLIERQEYSISLDIEYEILKEYKNKLNNRKTPQTNDFEDLIQRYAYSNEDNNVFETRIPVDESKVEELSDQGFHDEDLIFVRLGPASRSESIISSDEESIMEDEYKSWIEDNLEVTVCLPDDAENNILD